MASKKQLIRFHKKEGRAVNVWDLLFPPRCPLCMEILSFGDGQVHNACYRKLTWVREPICKQCGKPLMTANADVNMLCQDCLRNRHRSETNYDQGRALWVYEGLAKDSLMDFKFRGMKSYVEFYAEEAVGRYGSWIQRKQPQVLIPIPLHKRKRRMRGFNQAELLAEALSRKTGIPMKRDILYRRKWTDPQKNVSGTDRRKNLAESMEILDLPKELKCVLLIDDIYTTGSTMEACARILKQNGVKEVYFLTLCIGRDVE